jgi:hypothetical protein
MARNTATRMVERTLPGVPFGRLSVFASSLKLPAAALARAAGPMRRKNRSQGPAGSRKSTRTIASRSRLRIEASPKPLADPSGLKRATISVRPTTGSNPARRSISANVRWSK